MASWDYNGPPSPPHCDTGTPRTSSLVSPEQLDNPLPREPTYSHLNLGLDLDLYEWLSTNSNATLVDLLDNASPDVLMAIYVGHHHAPTCTHTPDSVNTLRRLQEEIQVGIAQLANLLRQEDERPNRRQRRRKWRSRRYMNDGQPRSPSFSSLIANWLTLNVAAAVLLSCQAALLQATHYCLAGALHLLLAACGTLAPHIATIHLMLKYIITFAAIFLVHYGFLPEAPFVSMPASRKQALPSDSGCSASWWRDAAVYSPSVYPTFECTAREFEMDEEVMMRTLPPTPKGLWEATRGYHYSDRRGGWAEDDDDELPPVPWAKPDEWDGAAACEECEVQDDLHTRPAHARSGEPDDGSVLNVLSDDSDGSSDLPSTPHTALHTARVAHLVLAFAIGMMMAAATGTTSIIQVVSKTARRIGRVRCALLVIVLLLHVALAADDTSTSKSPMFDGTRSSFTPWLIAFSGWVAYKLAESAEILDGSSPEPLAAMQCARRDYRPGWAS